MKIKIIVFVLIGLFLSSNFVFALEDKIIAIVNSDIITESEVKDYLNALYLQLSSQYKGKELEEEMSKVKEDVVDRLIEDRLIIQRGKELGMQLKDSVIETRYQFIKTQFPSDEEFDLYLKMKDLTPADLRQKIADQLLMRDVVEYEVKSQVFVHPQEATKFYNEHPEQFKDVEKLDLDSIFLRKDDSNKEAEKKVKEIQKLLKQGENFSAVREKFSQTSPLGIIRKGQLNEEIEKIVFKLNMGEVSSPIETNTGFYIVKLKERIITDEIPFGEVKEQISQYLHELKFQEKFIEWMEGLKDKAYVIKK